MPRVIDGGKGILTDLFRKRNCPRGSRKDSRIMKNRNKSGCRRNIESPNRSYTKRPGVQYGRRKKVRRSGRSRRSPKRLIQEMGGGSEKQT